MSAPMRHYRIWLTLALAFAACPTLALAATTYYIYDESGHVIGEYAADGTPIQEHVYLGDRPVAVVQAGSSTSGTVDYVSTDQLDTPRVITDSSQAVVWSWSSDPFGNGSPTGSLTYNLRFPGQYYDQETGHNYNFKRDYDAVTGRYIESDPIGLDGGINTYLYVEGNPIDSYDPTGELRYNFPPPRTMPIPPALYAKATCLEGCLGISLTITGGTEPGHTKNSLHYSGHAVDFGFNSNPQIEAIEKQFMCCALKCGFTYGQHEGAPRFAPQYHLQDLPGNGSKPISPNVCDKCKSGRS